VPTEQGIVIRIDTAATWVKASPSTACDNCSSKGMCHTLGGGKEAEVPVVNPVAARVGDRVVIKLETSPLLKATFLIYMFPILLLVVGAAFGEWISRAWALDSSLPSALLGFSSLAAGLAAMRIMARRLAEKSAYRPRIVRILGPASPDSSGPSTD
jgi:sigma-E factor negative regulatory protein RseC